MCKIVFIFDYPFQISEIEIESLIENGTSSQQESDSEVASDVEPIEVDNQAAKRPLEAPVQAASPPPPTEPSKPFPGPPKKKRKRTAFGDNSTSSLSFD